jgi:hypothetical protein
MVKRKGLSPFVIEQQTEAEEELIKFISCTNEIEGGSRLYLLARCIDI